MTNLEKSNFIANAFSNVYQYHDFKVSTTESEAVETSFEIIRNSVIVLTMRFFELMFTLHHSVS
jgi:hypothetical protein